MHRIYDDYPDASITVLPLFFSFGMIQHPKEEILYIHKKIEEFKQESR